MNTDLKYLATCVDIGHRFKIVSACKITGGYLGDFECKTCGYKKSQPLTYKQERACKVVGLID